MTSFVCALLAVSTIGVVADKAFDRERIKTKLAPDQVKFFEASELDAIKKFSAAGNQIVVSYCSDKRLADFMGVTVGPWTKMSVPSVAIGTADGKVLSNYRTGCVFQPAIPAGNPRHARVDSWFLDEKLKSLGIAAAIRTDRGVWYAHDIPYRPMTGGKLARLPGAMRVRGVWTTGKPLDAGGWPVTAKRLVASGFTTVFIKSDCDEFDAASRACRKVGLSVHAWVIAFGGESGRTPDSKAARAAVLKEARRIAAKNVDGIQFDYFRYPSRTLLDDAKKQQGALVVNAALKEILTPLRKEFKGLKWSIAVYPMPKSQAAVGQDVAAWMKTGLVDFFSPMCYTTSPVVFNGMVDENAAIAGPDKMVIGIGSGANESRLDDVGIQKQVDIASKKRLCGISLFSLDAELVSRLRD